MKKTHSKTFYEKFPDEILFKITLNNCSWEVPQRRELPHQDGHHDRSLQCHRGARAHLQEGQAHRSYCRGHDKQVGSLSLTHEGLRPLLMA
jgi:hypothetical protein